VRFCGLRYSWLLDVKDEPGHLALAAGSVSVGEKWWDGAGSVLAV